MPSSTPPHPAPDPGRILVRGVNWLGDAVMTTPALLRLRERFPQASITLLTPSKIAPLWKAHPAVDEVLEIPPGEGVLAVARRVRRGAFDLGIVLPNSPRSALELWLGGVPRRVGYATPWRGWMLTHSLPPRHHLPTTRKRSLEEIRSLRTSPPATAGPPPPAEAHHLHHYLQLLPLVGGSPLPEPPRLALAEAELEAFREKFQLSPSELPILGLNPGAEYGPAKRWPEERFIEAAALVNEAVPCRWLVFGGKADLAAAGRIANALTSRCHPGRAEVVQLAGRTSLRELMAGLRLCRALLTNDTGPMHVAAALGTPVVVPFGSTSPELTGPGLPGDPRHHLLRGTAPCTPCFLRECPVDFGCMTSIPAAHAARALLSVLASQPGA
ncbi:MAG TPA: lipopolysaccharide heptosyltransferase II [Verrucomicrobiales bacterium]|nr:lipopolysaccharide heptosyltransferase II [Verrucomicrobiales bacterium]